MGEIEPAVRGFLEEAGLIDGPEPDPPLVAHARAAEAVIAKARELDGAGCREGSPGRCTEHNAAWTGDEFTGCDHIVAASISLLASLRRTGAATHTVPLAEVDGTLDYAHWRARGGWREDPMRPLAPERW